MCVTLLLPIANRHFQPVRCDHFIRMSEFTFLLRRNEWTKRVWERARARSRNSHFSSIASLLIPIAYAVFTIRERIVPLIKHKHVKRIKRTSTNKKKQRISFLIFSLLLRIVVLVVFCCFCCCWRNYYNLFYAEKSLCPYTSNMSLHYLSTFSQFLLADCHSTGRRLLRTQRAFNMKMKEMKEKMPIELLLFLFMAKMMVITSSAVHKFWTKSRERDRQRGRREKTVCQHCCVAVVVELNWYTCIEIIAFSLIYLLRLSWYTNCV